MAAASEKVCVNCLSYGWGQPSVPSDMKHCGQCKIFDYCGVDCQREHWLKVHKKHCKYLAEKKVLAMSVHDEATCLVCKMGTEAATNLKDRVLPCTMSAATLAHMRIVVDTASPGLSLAEMTGKFHTKEEATLTQMMRLVTKMSLLEHPALSPRELYGKLYGVLSEARSICWLMQRSFNDDTNAKSGFVANKIALAPVLMLMSDIGLELFASGVSDEVKAIWNILAILTYFLYAEKNSLGRNIVESTDMLPGMSEDLARVRLTSSRLEAMWESVLKMFEGGLVPRYSEVLDVVCGGMIHKCLMCDNIVTIARVLLLVKNKDPGTVPVLLLSHGAVLVVLCAKPRCRGRLGRIGHEADLLVKLYVDVEVTHEKECCDYCGQAYRGRVGHRCSRCLTKLYCGEECRDQDQDWGVHKLSCKEGEED